MTREPHHSSPLLDTADEPHFVSPADWQAHLIAHAQLDQYLREKRQSDSIALKSANGWTLKGRAGYILAVVLMLSIDFIAWIWTRGHP